MIKKVLRWLGKRARERSTYAGLAAVAAGVGFPAAGPVISAIGMIVGGGLVAHQEHGLTPAKTTATD